MKLSNWRMSYRDILKRSWVSATFRPLLKNDRILCQKYIHSFYDFNKWSPKIFSSLNSIIFAIFVFLLFINIFFLISFQFQHLCSSLCPKTLDTPLMLNDPYFGSYFTIQGRDK